VTFTVMLGNISLNWSMTPRQDGHGGRSVPALVLGGAVFHINHGADLAALK
jgi:hypothetical protein